MGGRQARALDFESGGGRRIYTWRKGEDQWGEGEGISIINFKRTKRGEY